jgi:hypothetical protein
VGCERDFLDEVKREVFPRTTRVSAFDAEITVLGKVSLPVFMSLYPGWNIQATYCRAALFCGPRRKVYSHVKKEISTLSLGGAVPAWWCLTSTIRLGDVVVLHLSFAEHIHDSDACRKDARATKILAAHHLAHLIGRSYSNANFNSAP